METPARDPAEEGPGRSGQPERVTARDLVRRRRRDYRAPETGRHHHLGAAPVRQPLLGEDGVSYVETSPVQLASRTRPQLEAAREGCARAMDEAAQALDFERAAALRDAVAAVDAELARRSTGD